MDIQHEPAMWPECLNDELARLVYADWLEERYEGHELISFLRSGFAVTMDQFHDAVIWSEGSDPYEPSGWVAWTLHGVAFVAHFAHDTGYNTYDVLFDTCSDGWLLNEEADKPRALQNFKWVGTLEQLVHMARFSADPSMPDRTSQHTDDEYEELMAVYHEVLTRFGGTDVEVHP